MNDLAFDRLAGRLLVASPLLTDSHFERSVVLLCSHSGDGAFGLVLNRALPIAVAEPLPSWAATVTAPPSIFRGGPVGRERALALARLAPHAAAPPGWEPVLGRIGLLDLEHDPSEIGGIEAVRIFSGHAGWAGGQLEGELLGEAWWVVDAQPADAFDPDPEGLWKRVLRRQSGRLALFANYPPDVALN
ncbi:MAG: YqgE/AlgH family protein [Dehalococcoidia bacterium]